MGSVGRGSVCERISELGKLSPHSIALRQGDLELTYGELDRRAANFAGYLGQLGVLSGGTVAICMERSFDWIVAALGILRAGAAYVPLDPEWPGSRLRFALEDSGAAAVVARSAALERLETEVPGIDPARDRAAMMAAPSPEPVPAGPESLAYLIYTSGSTGVPKGTEITHANLLHLVHWHLKAFEVTAADRASHLAGQGFDAAVWEIWPHLYAGAVLCLADDAIRSSPDLIQSWMIRERVTIGFVPTVHAAPLMKMPWPAAAKLRILLTGGDTLHRAPAAGLTFKVVNNYGPTECTVVAASAVLQPGSETPPIGRAVWGAHVYLLDEHGDEAADGETGEIYIGGEGVGRGYRNLPDATRASFLPDPFSRVPGARMYRTGDRAVRRSDGEIEFRGRLDRQVKIRGYRIELDEIAAILSRQPGVGFATAAVHAAEDGEGRLAAYVLPSAEESAPSHEDLQEALVRALPHYMVPSVFVRLTALPLSSNGKLDTKLLPPLAEACLLERRAARPVADAVEVRLLALVRELLRNDSVTADDNFFLAGGHSLLGMQLIVRLRTAFGVDLTLRQLFEAPTPRNLARLVEIRLAQDRLAVIWSELLGEERIEPDTSFSELGGDESSMARLQQRIGAEFGSIDKAQLCRSQTIRQQAALLGGEGTSQPAHPPGVVPFRSQGTRDRIFWLHYPCPNLAKAMGDNQPFFYVTITGDDLKSLGRAPGLREIARCLAAKTVATQPKGPFILGGYCLGGILSYEVACQMQAAGHDVSLLVLLDAPSPRYCGPAESLSLMRRPVYLTQRLAQLGPRKSMVNLLHRLTRRPSASAQGEDANARDEAIQEMISLAAARYKPSTFDGKVALLLASETPAHGSFLPWWQSVVPRNLHTQYVTGQHGELAQGRAVQEVADAIASHLVHAEDGRTACVPARFDGQAPAAQN